MKNKFPQLVMALGILSLVTGGFMIQNAQANQPHMQSALEALRTAKAELNQAERDKGGHRTRAVELVNEAIEETRLGIESGNKH